MNKFVNDSKYTGFHNAIEVWHREMKDLWPLILVSEIEADQLSQLRDSFQKRGQTAPSYTAFVVKAIAMAMDEVRKEHPEVNGFIWRFLGMRKIHVFPKISCGVVSSIEMDGQDRVAVGVIFDPEKTPLDEMTLTIRSHADATSPNVKNVRFFYGVPKFLQIFFQWAAGLSPKIRFENRGSFNITSVGKFGVDIQSTPQSTSLQFGFGIIRDRVVARNGVPIVVPTFFLTCSFDRRIMNGKAASLVMDRTRKILNAAEFPGER